MHDDHVDTQDAPETDAPREDYSAPELKDLGSFEELTQFNPTGATDTEGSS
jgi:hypothetical protein